MLAAGGRAFKQGQRVLAWLLGVCQIEAIHKPINAGSLAALGRAELKSVHLHFCKGEHKCKGSRG